MPTLTAWCYQTPLGARVGEVRLRRLQDAGSLEVQCAIAIMWARGAHRPRMAHVRHRVRSELDETGMLTSLARTMLAVTTSDAPRSGAAALAGRLRGTGIDSDFLISAGRHFSPGCSVLLLLSGRADLNVVQPLVKQGLADGGVELVLAEVQTDAVARIGVLLESLDI